MADRDHMSHSKRMGIASRIRQARMDAGWTQRELALRMGVSHSLIAHWELELCAPTIANRLDLARLLGVPFMELLPEAGVEIDDGTPANLVVNAIVRRVLKLPPPVQQALLVQIEATAETLASATELPKQASPKR